MAVSNTKGERLFDGRELIRLSQEETLKWKHRLGAAEPPLEKLTRGTP
jgi:hypothetical protein